MWKYVLLMVLCLAAFVGGAWLGLSLAYTQNKGVKERRSKKPSHPQETKDAPRESQADMEQVIDSEKENGEQNTAPPEGDIQEGKEEKYDTQSNDESNEDWSLLATECDLTGADPGDVIESRMRTHAKGHGMGLRQMLQELDGQQ